MAERVGFEPTVRTSRTTAFEIGEPVLAQKPSVMRPNAMRDRASRSQPANGPPTGHRSGGTGRTQRLGARCAFRALRADVRWAHQGGRRRDVGRLVGAGIRQQAPLSGTARQCRRACGVLTDARRDMPAWATETRTRRSPLASYPSVLSLRRGISDEWRAMRAAGR